MKKIFRLYFLLMISLAIITYENNRVDSMLAVINNYFLGMIALALTFGLLMTWLSDSYTSKQSGKKLH